MLVYKQWPLQKHYLALMPFLEENVAYIFAVLVRYLIQRRDPKHINSYMSYFSDRFA